MKMKKKGKVYPSPPPTQPPPSSSSSSSSHYYLNEDESLSVLRLLPATILVLVSVLSAEDREVLAYLITRGTTTISVDSNNKKKTKTKKNSKSSRKHKPPVFDCECFDCYTNYWLRWDSSPNRELIHDIIEAFENHHLTTGGEDSTSRNKSKRGKKKEKPAVIETAVSESHVLLSPENSPGRLSEAEVAKRETQGEEEEVVEEEESTVVFPAAAAASGHKGLARKVLPDVLGLFNSSFWRLWNPNA
ncbi:hypothetical protein N665_3749s0002 [Sinapis alba]|nr:hypothetical protein N665_3749s0002 [Sinapis alba]